MTSVTHRPVALVTGAAGFIGAHVTRARNRETQVA